MSDGIHSAEIDPQTLEWAEKWWEENADQHLAFILRLTAERIVASFQPDAGPPSR